jgi:hypothetical protein
MHSNARVVRSMGSADEQLFLSPLLSHFPLSAFLLLASHSLRCFEVAILHIKQGIGASFVLFSFFLFWVWRILSVSWRDGWNLGLWVWWVFWCEMLSTSTKACSASEFVMLRQNGYVIS